MTERRIRNPKTHQLCVRVTPKQHELLTSYTDYKGFESGASAIRFMIDGLETWLLRQEAANSGLSENEPPSINTAPSINRGDDVDRITHTDADRDEVRDVGDFAGRANVGLPESNRDSDF